MVRRQGGYGCRPEEKMVSRPRRTGGEQPSPHNNGDNDNINSSVPSSGGVVVALAVWDGRWTRFCV